MSLKVNSVQTPPLSADEIFAINTVLKCAEEFGYGNMMGWLATAWRIG